MSMLSVVLNSIVVTLSLMTIYHARGILRRSQRLDYDTAIHLVRNLSIALMCASGAIIASILARVLP